MAVGDDATGRAGGDATGDAGLWRLQRYIARSGGPSRRASEAAILAGRVRVNGQVVATLGAKVDPMRDEVRLDGRVLSLPQEHTTIALNKPVGFECSMHPRTKHPSAATLVPASDVPGLVNVGRLDVATRGLLLFTNDGGLAGRLVAPRFKVEKAYEAKVEGRFTQADADRLRNGVAVPSLKGRAGYVSAPAKVEVLRAGERESLVRIVVHEGRYHEVRNICKAVGHAVRDLRRVEFGPVRLDGLAEGEWRAVEGDELSALYASCGL